eukprot:CAMPEP_0182451838 /NCGR_PEP_ID=MMETSP1172-20130603/43938_1 /TAXON_ID=708627 /ORGANISM="Timspurckia oligopyrenoides, Strain CCMP3278" /LENGTH=249 /DNA_ID=CAMNT_0024649645 /DNA_START=99 /DNA_END=848 /DNA_ORIENTATION=+
MDGVKRKVGNDENQEGSRPGKVAKVVDDRNFFVLWSCVGYTDEDFHDLDGCIEFPDREVIMDDEFPSAVEANTRAEALFSEDNPWGAGEIEKSPEKYKLKRKLSGPQQLLTLAASTDDSLNWTVSVCTKGEWMQFFQAREALDEDEEDGGASGSEDEDDDEDFEGSNVSDEEQENGQQDAESDGDDDSASAGLEEDDDEEGEEDEGEEEGENDDGGEEGDDGEEEEGDGEGGDGEDDEQGDESGEDGDV